MAINIRNQKNIQRRCQICKQQILVDFSGHGKCSDCGWRQSEMGWEHPNRVMHPNMVSFNRARKLAAQGKPLNPTLDDFVEAFGFYGEMQFTYKDIEYVVGFENGKFIVLWSGKTNQNLYFSDYDDFATNAHINGILLKDIWHEVENADYM